MDVYFIAHIFWLLALCRMLWQHPRPAFNSDMVKLLRLRYF
ncbi:hypothetical protein D1AOALGA4SA_9267 [Olavius algarvensis Delta 1 endosymbiont]|nr:hypothetical protein D1AOALGA4SA_9267 [Olavius algarvensis Delta 1 endosymbiont]